MEDGRLVTFDVPDTYEPLYHIGLAVDQTEPFRASLPYDSISLERTQVAWGPGVVYRVTFHRSGTATLYSSGTRGSPPKGEFKGEVSLHDYAYLCYALDHFRFNALKTDYSATSKDDSAAIVTATAASGEKRVRDYGRVGPVELWAIQQVIDAARGRIDWTPSQ